MKTIEEVKNDLNLLKIHNNFNKYNFNPEVALKREKIRKERYDRCVELGMLKEAEQIADSVQALKVGEKLKTVADLEYIYSKAIKLLAKDDCELAKAAFWDGLTYEEIAVNVHYSEQAIKYEFAGRKDKKGIYQKICDIINEGEG